MNDPREYCYEHVEPCPLPCDACHYDCGVGGLESGDPQEGYCYSKWHAEPCRLPCVACAADCGDQSD